MQLDPDDAVLFSDRSLCWLHMGDGRKALLDANKCRKMRPHWPKACRRQGEALMLLKDYEGASERFLDGLKLDPVDTDIEDALREAMKSLKTSRSTKARWLFGCCRGISWRLETAQEFLRLRNDWFPLLESKAKCPMGVLPLHVCMTMAVDWCSNVGGSSSVPIDLSYLRLAGLLRSSLTRRAPCAASTNRSQP